MTHTFIPHGGNLGDAIQRYGIARADWLDLSAGINPLAYPVPALDAQTWQRLPDDADGLDALAAHYYGAPLALAMAGTQAAIQLLPQVLRPGQIGIGLLTYGEYAPAFAAAGFGIRRFVTEPVADLLTQADFLLSPTLPPELDYLVLVNPNNPSAELFAPEVVLAWQQQLAARGGGLIVDEAFMDAQRNHSIAAHSHLPGLIVLRSIGKFFGLAGARAGFVLAAPDVINALHALRGPWSLSGPTRAVVSVALQDRAWQMAQRPMLIAAGARLSQLLVQHGLTARHTSLFAWARTEQAERWQDLLAQQGIWVRRFAHVPSIRLGLPPDAAAWARLDTALQHARAQIGSAC